jgi:hypothetical protein
MRNYFILGLLCFALSGLSQNENIAHRYTVSLQDNYSDLLTTSDLTQTPGLKYIRKLHSNGRIISLEFEPGLPLNSELAWLRNNPSIKYFQAVKKLEPRGCNPNDKEYWRQYNMEIMKFDEVWCYKNEGLSALGDTIVVGAIDAGFNFEYQDLLPNVFINHAEIPDNGIDDDANGYVDDYYGYNAHTLAGGDNHPIYTHGTQVISVIGAKGNNKIDISGTNQNIKMLLCSADDSEELLRCYYYFVNMKRAFQNSNGTRGAFMVSANLSAGFSNSFPGDFPLICQVYDYLGKLGILNSVATINDGDDIDLVGDIPGLCPSDHLIVVTNTNRFDQKVAEAGYSKNNVDIGASGEDIPLIDAQGNVGNESGTSFASPHVAGAVALMYQFCTKLNELQKSDPAAASLVIKHLILSCGDDLSSLKNVSLSGKRLNMLKTLECLNTYCLSSDSLAKVRFTLRNNLKNEPLEIYFNPERFGDYNLMIFNALGQNLHQTRLSFYPDIDNTYEVSVSGWPTGVYFVVIEGQGRYWSESLMKY